MTLATPPEVHAKHLELGFRSGACAECYPPAAPPRRIRHRQPLRPGGRGTLPTLPPAGVGSRPLQAAATATQTGTAG